MKWKRALLAFLAAGTTIPVTLLTWAQMKQEDWWFWVADTLALWMWVALMGMVAVGFKDEM